jgi:hypothetical protein
VTYGGVACENTTAVDYKKEKKNIENTSRKRHITKSRQNGFTLQAYRIFRRGEIFKKKKRIIYKKSYTEIKNEKKPSCKKAKVIKTPRKIFNFQKKPTKFILRAHKTFHSHTHICHGCIIIIINIIHLCTAIVTLC